MLTLDRIAQRYNTTPWEIENAPIEWLQIISMIIDKENGKVSKAKSLGNLQEKIKENGKQFKG